jgi:3-methyladenine DNA glycosylase AlkD
MWDRRISVVSTLMLIRNGQYDDTLKLAEILLHSSHDLMRKAVGWMLREVGKKDESILRSFLDKHYKVMPRTMLRYAIERLPDDVRMSYMK